MTYTLDQISDDIRQVMEVLRSQPDADHRQSAPTFDLAAEVSKETDRALSKDLDRHVYETMTAETKRFDLLQADLESCMRDDEHETIKRVVAARNNVMRERAR